MRQVDELSEYWQSNLMEWWVFVDKLKFLLPRVIIGVTPDSEEIVIE